MQSCSRSQRQKKKKLSSMLQTTWNTLHKGRGAKDQPQETEPITPTVLTASVLLSVKINFELSEVLYNKNKSTHLNSLNKRSHFYSTVSLHCTFIFSLRVICLQLVIYFIWKCLPIGTITSESNEHFKVKRGTHFSGTCIMTAWA